MNKDEIILRGIDEIPMFTFNTKTKEFRVLGHKFEGVNSIEDFINYIHNLGKENKELKEKVNQLETNIDEAIEYLTSYEAIHTIQFGVEEVDEKDLYNNKGLDEKTITEMTNRYLKVHDKLLSILERGKE